MLRVVHKSMTVRAYLTSALFPTAGAVLTHANLIADAAGTCELLDDWQPGDRHISYLPLAHIYERNNMTVAVHLGGSVGFYSGNVTELLDDVLVRQRCSAA